MNYLIRNATIVNEGKIYQASVLIENNIIKKITNPHKFIKTNAEVINAIGLLLLPGIIDSHVHFRDPGFTYKGDIESESKAAVAGGVTSFIDMPNTLPQTTSEENLDLKLNLAKNKSWANYGFMVGATNSNTKELLAIPENKYAGIKLFLGSSTGDMLVNNEDAISHLFKNAKKTIVAHCEDEEIIKANTERIKKEYGDNPPPFCHPLIRTAEACYTSTLKAVEYAQQGNAHLHIAHLTTKKELELLQKNKYKNVSAEVCVNHLWFDESDYDTLGNKIKCNPAIKTSDDREALIEGVKTPAIHTIATDHAPHTLEEKSQPYFSAPSGIPCIQFSLQMMLELYQRGVIPLETIVEKMCHNPARLFGIEKRGFVKEGYFADLVLVDINSPVEITEKNIFYKSNWSPLEGSVFKSTVKTTFVNGNMVFNNGEFFEPNGEMITYS